MKKRSIVVLSGIILILLIVLYIGNVKPQIKYEVFNAYSGYHAVLMLNQNSDYSLELISNRGQLEKKFCGKLSNHEIRKIKKSLLSNGFITLEEDLSDYSLLDNSTEELHVKLGVLTLNTGGYGVSDQRFRKIVKDLESLIASHR
ncbi:hypothetical protein J40TS1_31410 [Paenibacillus montaniterrae]|uniref:Uncharacterized protein n=1 Tax=Paenibacillus montaniterrae TaxID=429341 RepID=A0A920CZZ7_9BACL|nr:hypothetical protein [Paenibacillus montaniterrae]GIP17499.1 hypothetical protein J40TS1_31410 [Paenibacillus montaniterrae]